MFLARVGFAAVRKTSVLSVVSTLGKRFSHELAPRFKHVGKRHKGRVPVRTGGSTKGSTIEFGEYGIRLKSEGVRMSANQLKEADAVILRMMRPIGAKIWRRLCTNVAVCTKGNETRMGKGKGAFDYWAVRVPTGKIIFEIGGSNTLHEKVAREAFRKAGEKLPGVFEFVKKNDALRVGLKAIKETGNQINYLETLKQNPTKVFGNVLKSKLPEYRLYTGRKR
ncbi:hypothetical protein PACTADRAFT_52046 [Pachysolen tannophilus NRRL Y-2460]|uniref:Uncharacterized protein n=1 Tax=Pachysolen tannophilus NRRL Y-2460 TaxID=669874 RepID=A0A1E4TNX8_PACTA|nr:hypothetical protein PACTADRAFT_52046 [Pachysolen tannophilus NRRL Y-2460]